MVRLAKALEAVHASGRTHGRISPHAIVFDETPRASSPVVRESRSEILPQARLKRPENVLPAADFHSPQRGDTGAPSRDDDAYSLALLLFVALTNQGPKSRGANGKFPPLAVFDAGDDALDELLSSALSPALGSEFRDLALLRRELDLWLEERGVKPDDDDAPLPWFEEPESRKAIDLSSLPPPPRPPTPSETDETTPTRNSVIEIDEHEVELSDGATSSARREPKIVPPKVHKKGAAKSAREPASDAAAPILPTEPEQRSWITRILLPVGAVAALSVGAYYAYRNLSPEPETAASATSVGATASTTATTAVRAADRASASAAVSVSASPTTPVSSLALASSASASATVSSSASASVSGPTATAAVSDPVACIQGVFSADTFATRPEDIGFVCTETDVVKGAARLRTRIVVAGAKRDVTVGMKEWALLGFFELAAFIAIHDRCCPAAPKIKAPQGPASCDSVEEALRDISSSVSSSETGAAKKLDKAIVRLDRAARCVIRAHRGDAFGNHPSPTGGEGTALKKVLARVTAYKE